MAKIDFAIIGAQKSGTTALFDMLRQHPGICVPMKKEDGYFVQDELYRKGDAYLSDLYQHCASVRLVGYSYVNLMYFHDVTVQKLYHNNPAMKFLCVLRDPVNRAYSAYQFMRSRGVEEAKTFEDALSRERNMQNSGDFSYNADLTYLKHGLYVEQLFPFVERFGFDSLLVFTQDELKRDYKRVCSETFDFLNLPDISGDVQEKISNKTGQPASRLFSRLVYKDGVVKRIYRSLVGDEVRAAIRRNVVARLMQLNLRDSDYAPMKTQTRVELQSFYKTYNKKLEDLLGKKFNW